MLTPIQIITLFEYCKYFRMATQQVINEAGKNRSIDEETRAAILKEQRRRLRQLAKLEKALGAEIDEEQNKNKDEKKCKRKSQPGRAAKDRKGKKKPNARKSKGQGDGTCTTDSSEKRGKRKSAGHHQTKE